MSENNRGIGFSSDLFAVFHGMTNITIKAIKKVIRGRKSSEYF